MMSFLQAVIIAIIEGLTEFLPISSTGHMIIATSAMKINQADFTKLFTVNIQLGAILAVLVLYWKKFFNSVDFYIKLVIAFIPVAIVGILFKDSIHEFLGRIDVVIWSLIIGGVFLLFVDRIFKNPVIDDHKKINYQSAFVIGLFQCIAVIPGVSRAAATITGGLFRKLDRKIAAEFSFFLAVPTMLAAATKDMYDYYKLGITLSGNQVNILIVGNVVAFIVALIVLKFMISFVVKYGFKAFGIYRIVLGLVLLYLIHIGVDMNIPK